MAAILIVDDVSANVMLLRGILTREGHEVRTASSGSECLRLVAESKPDLILLDLFMPGMNGDEVIGVLKESEESADIPILMVSANEEVQEVVRCLDLGAQDYVSKPINRRMMLARVRLALRIKEAQDEKDRLLARLEESYRMLEAVTEDLARVSLEDRLTGIGNRRAMETELDRVQARASRYRRPYAVILVDVDFFKDYNDHHGHQAGDEVLKQVATALGTDLRETDSVFRYGGEEFLVLLPETPIAPAAGVADRLRQRVEALGIPHPRAGEGSITISLGVAGDPAGSEAPIRWEEVVERADAALYRAKNAGRNCVVSSSS